jgi:glycosyltransferase involved in cell wall biosynthesis
MNGCPIDFIHGRCYGNDCPRGLMKIIHVISGLVLGGAESMLRRLVESSEESISESVVVSLTSLGTLGELLRKRGVTVYTLGMSSPVDFPVTLWRLFLLIQHYRPAVVQTWMYHADLIGGLAAQMAGSCSIVWGIRSTSIPQGRFSITYWLIRLCAISSHFIPDRIICCANSAKAAHIKLGYAEKKMMVIPNGYDFSAFQCDEEIRLKARKQLGVNERDVIIGIVGRFDPLKDFFNFVSAAVIVAAKYENIRFLMVGRGNDYSNDILRNWIESAGLTNRFHLVGQQTDVAHFLSAMDIFCISSVNEAFPNVVVEAMAMRLPCVVTQAGDASIILDNDDYVVPVKDPVALANALLKMCSLDPMSRKSLGERNAEKVTRRYGIISIRQNYAQVYEEVTKQK